MVRTPTILTMSFRDHIPSTSGLSIWPMAEPGAWHIVGAQ